MNKTTASDDSAALIYAGVNVPALLRTGERVTVKLRLIKISEIPAFLDLALEEAKALEFCVDSPKPFDPDAFTDESYSELLAKNTALNFTRALVVSDQRLKRAETCGVALAQVATNLGSLLRRFSAGSPSPEDTPASSSST
jgi:hypothetical protein